MRTVKTTLVLTGVFMSQLTYALSSDQLSKAIVDFNLKFNRILMTADDKANFSKSFISQKAEIEKWWDEFDKSQGSEITKDGNQISLKIESLKPLENLAQNGLTADECKKAIDDNTNGLTAIMVSQKTNKVIPEIKSIHELLEKAIHKLCANIN